MGVIGALEFVRIVVALCIPAPQLSAVQFDVQSVGCLGHEGKRSVISNDGRTCRMPYLNRCSVLP